MIESVLTKRPGKPLKLKVLQLQKICGFLNFLGRAIVPGRAFTRRLYSYLSSKKNKLQQYHHIRITSEMKSDLTMWLKFLLHPAVFCRPFMDYSLIIEVNELEFYVDATKNPYAGIWGLLLFGLDAIPLERFYWRMWSQHWIFRALCHDDWDPHVDT